MYFVDREKIESLLRFMEEQFHMLETHTKWESPLEVRALERITHILIEAFLDVGNQIIDGFIMRDPGSYEDIVEILIDESVLDSASQTSFFALIHLRKPLVQDYAAFPVKELIQTIDQHQASWRTFPERVREYLESELGPVSAFKPTQS